MGGTISYLEDSLTSFSFSFGKSTYNMVNNIFNSVKKTSNNDNLINNETIKEINKNDIISNIDLTQQSEENTIESAGSESSFPNCNSNIFVILVDGNIVGYTKKVYLAREIIKKTKENMYLTYSCNTNYFYNWEILNELNIDNEQPSINNLSKLVYKAVFTRRLKNAILSYDSMIHSLEILQLKSIEELINWFFKKEITFLKNKGTLA